MIHLLLYTAYHSSFLNLPSPTKVFMLTVLAKKEENTDMSLTLKLISPNIKLLHKMNSTLLTVLHL